MLRGENLKLKAWQRRCGVPPRAAACAEKQNAPALYRRGRARRGFFEKFFAKWEDASLWARGANEVARNSLQAQRLLDADRDLVLGDCLDKGLDV